MGGESRYPINNPSKQLSFRSFSILRIKPKLNPWFITGFIDAEGTFCCTIYKNKAYKTGWVVRSFIFF
jgi:hypothetical protein